MTDLGSPVSQDTVSLKNVKNFILKGITYQKKCVSLHPEIDARKVEQCGKHLYCPKLKFRQKYPEDKIPMPFAFSSMYWLTASAYR